MVFQFPKTLNFFKNFSLLSLYCFHWVNPIDLSWNSLILFSVIYTQLLIQSSEFLLIFFFFFLKGDVRSIAVWGISLISLLEITTNWANTIQQKRPSLTNKHIWEIYTLEQLKLGGSGKQGKRKGRGMDAGAAEAARSSLQDAGRGGN